MIHKETPQHHHHQPCQQSNNYKLKKKNYFRVFDNLLMQEKLVYPTLGKEELNLSIGPMALTVAEVITTSLLLFTLLDALASLDFKLSVTKWVTFLQLAHLEGLSDYFSFNSSLSLGLWLRWWVTHLYRHFCPSIYLMGGTSNLL